MDMTRIRGFNGPCNAMRNVRLALSTTTHNALLPAALPGQPPFKMAPVKHCMHRLHLRQLLVNVVHVVMLMPRPLHFTFVRSPNVPNRFRDCALGVLGAIVVRASRRTPHRAHKAASDADSPDQHALSRSSPPCPLSTSLTFFSVFPISSIPNDTRHAETSGNRAPTVGDEQRTRRVQDRARQHAQAPRTSPAR